MRAPSFSSLGGEGGRAVQLQVSQPDFFAGILGFALNAAPDSLYQPIPLETKGPLNSHQLRGVMQHGNQSWGTPMLQLADLARLPFRKVRLRLPFVHRNLCCSFAPRL
jgi:hypothetical protein